MTQIDPRLGMVNPDYPPFLANDFIRTIMDHFSDWSKTDDFFLVGGTVVDALFYPENPLNDLDINYFSFTGEENIINNLTKNGLVSKCYNLNRNFLSKAHHYSFAPHERSDLKYEVTFIDNPNFVGQYSPECPLIQYSTGLFIEQGPFIQAHRDKTISFIRPIEFENKQDLLIRFIHVMCKYGFPADKIENLETLSRLREAFNHRDIQENILYNKEWLDKKLLQKAEKAASRPNQCWSELKQQLKELNFDQVLSPNAWQGLMSI